MIAGAEETLETARDVVPDGAALIEEACTDPVDLDTTDEAVDRAVEVVFAELVPLESYTLSLD